MKNKNKNIAKFFSENLPDPEIPADDAWGNMNDMLHATPVGGKAGHGVKVSTFKLVSGLISAGIVTVGVVLFLSNDKKEFPVKSEKASSSAISALEKSNNEIAKVGESGKIRQGVETEIGIGPGKIKGAGKEVKTERSEGIEKREGVERKDESGENKETKKGETSAKYPGRNSLVTEALGNIRKSAKPSRESNSNLSKSDERKRFAGMRDSQFASKPVNGKAAKESSGNINVATEDRKRSELALFPLKSLRFKPKFYDPGFSVKVKAITELTSAIAGNIPKQPRERSFEIGLEWNLNSPLKQTDFLFTGLDSIRKPALLLIPGIYMTQSLKENHLVTFSLTATQPYFGNNGKLAQVLDSLPGRDSLYSSRSTNLIKTVGINLALQYHYQFANHFTVGAGVAYSRISGAFVQKWVYHANDEPLLQEQVTIKNSEQVGRYLNRNIFYFKAGVSYRIGRLQTGVSIFAPVSNVSAMPRFPIRAVNGQFFLRFRVWQSEKP